jgi:hypothetical protein
LAVGFSAVNHDNSILSEIFSGVQVTGSALDLFSSLPEMENRFTPHGVALAEEIRVV